MKDNGDSKESIAAVFQEFLDELTDGGDEMAKVKEYYEMLYEENIDRTHVVEK